MTTPAPAREGKRWKALVICATITDLGAFASFFAVVAGLIGFSGEWDSALIVKVRSWEFTFDQAWTYLGPAIALACALTLGMFASMITLAKVATWER